jgi:hypothetical protein
MEPAMKDSMDAVSHIRLSREVTVKPGKPLQNGTIRSAENRCVGEIAHQARQDRRRRRFEFTVKKMTIGLTLA